MQEEEKTSADLTQGNIAGPIITYALTIFVGRIFRAL